MNGRSIIPFARPDITDEEIHAVERVLRSGWLTSGPETERFETEFAEAVDARFAIAVNSATAALHLGLESFGIAEHDAVLVPSITFTATAEVAEYNNTLPIVLDVDRESYLLTPQIVEAFIETECSFSNDRLVHKPTGRTIRALLPVHLGGRACDMERLGKIAKQYGLRTIEDAAHAFPTSRDGRKIGSTGDIVAFSFYATKNLTTGEGGMVTTDSSAIDEKLRRIRLHGIRGQTYGRKRWHYDVIERGYKYNLSDIASAIGRVQLRRSPEMLLKRQKIAELYRKGLGDLEAIRLLPAIDGESYHLFTIEINDGAPVSRDEFVERMFENGIQTSLHFIPLYRHTYYREKYGLRTESYPNSEEIYKRMVSLPIYSALETDGVSRIIETIRSITG